MRIKSVVFGNETEAYYEKNIRDGVNLIFSCPHNNKGKTVVVQSIFYALGNEPKFPSSFDPQKDNYYIVEIESNNKLFLICRRKNNFVVRSSEGLFIFTTQSEFKRFYSKHINELPYIIKDGREKMVDLFLYNHLFFLSQDGRDTSKLLNVAHYKNIDFINMICSMAGVSIIDASENIYELKKQETELLEKRKCLISKNKVLRSRKYSAHISTYTANKAEIEKKLKRLEAIKNEIKDYTNERNKHFKRISKNELLIKELNELNKKIEEGSFRCNQCGSSDVVYSIKEFEFDVSNIDIRNQILNSIQNRIDSSKDEVERISSNIAEKQKELNELLKDEEISIENYLIYKRDILNSLDADEKIRQIDEQIDVLRAKIEGITLEERKIKETKKEFLSKLSYELSNIYSNINVDGRHELVELFTKQNEVLSGSEGAAFFIARLLALQSILKHNHPIIIDCFRDGELSTIKEAIVVDYFNKTGNQVILTATFKAEEKGKYYENPQVNLIDYSNYKNSHIMDVKYVETLISTLLRLGIYL